MRVRIPCSPLWMGLRYRFSVPAWKAGVRRKAHCRFDPDPIRLDICVKKSPIIYSMLTVVKEGGVSGRGVFATKDIRKGKRFLVNPLFITKKKDYKNLLHTDLSNYWYEWSRNTFAVAMGHGSFFNHSSSANAEYELDEETKQIFFTAVRSIKKGEEIFINYHGEPNCKDRVWFQK